MLRRNILTAALAGAGGLIAAATAPRHANAAPDKSKVVYHLSDLDKVAFVLGNIRNHFAGMGGPDKVTIALVVHGPALKAFQAKAAPSDVAKRLEEFSNADLDLLACGNTMKAQRITVQDLLPGFVAVEEGGVVRIAELQSQGYVYLRP